MMTIYLRTLFLIILSVSAALAQAPAAKTPMSFTEKDREFALKHLNDSKAEFLKEVGGLSEAQLNFRTGPTRWTPLEIAEHIVVTETALLGMVQGSGKWPTFGADDKYRIGDNAVVLTVTNRLQKFTAPEQITPASRWKTRDDVIAAYEKQRGQTIDFIKNNKDDLRNRLSPNGMIGPMDAFQWLLYAIAHGERHMLQLKEVKSDPNFPKK